MTFWLDETRVPSFTSCSTDSLCVVISFRQRSSGSEVVGCVFAFRQLTSWDENTISLDVLRSVGHVKDVFQDGLFALVDVDETLWVQVPVIVRGEHDGCST